MNAAASDPAVSVIIPTHNRAHLVSGAIDSVLAQSYRDLEIVVVDDGSTDDTLDVLKGYGDRIRVCSTFNGGVAHARNIGMRHARGRYLTFLDSDDALYPYALELLTALLERRPDVGLVCAEMSGCDSSGVIERYHLKTYHRSSYRDPSLSYDAIYSSSRPLADLCELPRQLLLEDPSAALRRAYFGNVFNTYLLNLVLCQNSVMVRRSVVDQVGERNVGVRHWQEVDYLLTITRNHSVCFVDVPTYKLTYHPGQISSTSERRGRYVWMRKQQILLRVVKRHACADAAYYLQHRRRIDAHLAHLHRAVAVPMLLQERRSASRDWAKFARLYLARCARYGRPAPALHLASFAPASLRGIAVGVVESCRELYRRAIERVGRPPYRAGYAGPVRAL